ncbi:recombinase family protein [uncultured Oscillibacter sp.]|uniref:recombinase family protein n=1 Tax=uncultured Oscillibacter sp. TaxID=876091 RepID=UPI0028064D81|nr:recombinase family protein [uncultured Oscillibacter sp.]
MNAVIYARYSSHRQGEQSIEGQLAEAKKYAETHCLTIIHEYIDRAQTGRNDNREQFQLMLADAAKRAFDALIVWKTDRIGRNKEEIALNKYRLKKNGVKIHYIAEMIPDTPEGIILEAVIEGMAACYSEQLSQNIRRGQRASAAKAQSTGGNRPLGYKTGPDKRFIIDPETAPTVKLVYDLYARGQTMTQIIRTLNAKGLRTLRGRPFTNNSLRTLLKNEKYIGVYIYKDEIRIEDAIPSIVEPEAFYKVQEMLKYNQKAAAHKNSKADYLLTEKLLCGKCGQMMVGVSGTSKTGTRHHYYYCTEQRKKRCCKKPVRREWIEGLVLEYVVALVQNEDLLDFIAENTYQYYLAQNTDTSYTESLQKALEETEKATANLIWAMEAGIFNEATKNRMNELDEQKEELKAALSAARLREDLGLKKEHILYFLHRFAEMDCTDEACRKQLIKTFVNSVFVYDDKVVLTFNYSGDDRTITLHEIDAGLQQGVRLPRALCHHEKACNHNGYRLFSCPLTLYALVTL